MGNVMTSGAHGRTSCSALMFFHRSESLRRQTEMVEAVAADSEKANERLSHVLKIEDQALIHAKSPGVHNRESCRKDLFHASVPEIAIHVWRNGLA